MFVQDILRGGTFTKYVGPAAADNGMIFLDANGNKWKRSIGAGEKINLTWYGLSDTALITTPTNYNAFIGAYNYCQANATAGDIYVPSGTYNFNQTINITKSILIAGNGSYLNLKSVFIFKYGVTGFIARTIEGQANTVFEVSNLEARTDANFTNPQDYQPIDTTKHGFDIACIFIFRNVASTNWPGDAFHINACAISGHPNYGNSDGSQMVYCDGSFSNNGIYLFGCDANIISIHNNNFSLNRRYGIWDHGMLGNDYIKNHMAYNGVYKTFCTALYSGVYYAAINADSNININKRPDLNPDYWAVINFTPYTSNVWSDTVKYWSGGAANRENVNNYSLILGEYTEGAQPPSRNKGRALTIGGDNGSGVAEGAWIYADDNRIWIKNADLVTENIATTGSISFTGYQGIPVLTGINGTLSTINGNALQVLRRNASNTGYEFADISGTGGITQETLNDSLANIHAIIANDYRASNFIAGTNYLAPNGNGSALTGITPAQVGLGNLSNNAQLTIANNLSDLNDPAVARTNLGGTTIGKNLYTLANPGAVTFPRFNADNTVTSRSAAQLLSDIGAQAAGNYQPLNSNLTTIAGLTATTDNFIVSVAGAWASRTPAEVKTTLLLNNVTNESKATMFTNASFTGTFTPPDGTISNQKLVNSTITINGVPVSLGGSTTVSGSGQTFQQTLATSALRLF